MLNKKDLCTLCLIGLYGAFIHAEVPEYEEDTGILTVPSVEADGQPGRFQNVILEPSAENTWRLSGADEGVLLEARYVEQVRTMSSIGTPVQYFVRLLGTFPNDCPEIGRIEQKKHDNTLDLYIYYQWNEWLRDPESASCAEVQVPFELTVPLEVYGLKAGEYAVQVNGYPIRTFTLERDNVAPHQVGPGAGDHCQFEPYAGTGFWQSYSCTYGISNAL